MFDQNKLPKGMVLESEEQPKVFTSEEPTIQHPPQSARSEEYNILGDITKALRALPFDVSIDEAILFESDSSETSVKLNLSVTKPKS